VILAHKPDLNATGKDGLTPLRLAETLHQKDIADLLDPATALTPALVQATAAPVDQAAATEVIKRLMANASRKPPGAMEKDVTDEVLDIFRSAHAMTNTNS